MTKITLKGNEINTSGELPSLKSKAKEFNLVKTNLSEVNLENYAGKNKILNIFPSVDTGTCAMSVREFNKRAAELNDTVVLCISKDLPFALSRFCGAEGIENVDSLSAFRTSFAKDYGLEIIDGPLKGLCSRCVIILNKENEIIYTEQVMETADEPDYSKALQVLN